MAAFVAAALCITFAAGCYTFVPSASGIFAPGKTVALDLNDLGRLNLSNLVGSDVMRLSGLLVDQTSSGYTVKVDQLTYLNGRTAEWSGEALSVRRDFISVAYEQKLSSSKTALAVLASAGAVAGLVAARSIIGSGDADTGKPSVPAPPNTIRIGNH
jgi:hypothetical protein